MEYTISTATLAILIVEVAIAFLIPFILYFVLRIKKRVDAKPFFIGFAVMLVFNFILKSIVSLGIMSVSGELMNNIWFYGIVGGLLAGIFEETGRYIAMKYVLKKNYENDYNSIAFGLGHGGFELMIILGVATIGNLTVAMLVYTGDIGTLISSMDAASAEAFKNSCKELCEASPLLFLISPFERTMAYIAQIALSVVVWFGVKSNDIKLLPIAILLHTLLDAIAAIVFSLSASYALTEILVCVCAVLIAIYAKKIWDKNTTTA